MGPNESGGLCLAHGGGLFDGRTGGPPPPRVFGRPTNEKMIAHKKMEGNTPQPPPLRCSWGAHPQFRGVAGGAPRASATEAPATTGRRGRASHPLSSTPPPPLLPSLCCPRPFALPDVQVGDVCRDMVALRLLCRSPPPPPTHTWPLLLRLFHRSMTII